MLPEDNSVGNVMLDIEENIDNVIGQASSADYIDNQWTGSLMNLDLSSGYWLRLTDADTLDGSGYPLNLDRIYNLESGANLVSFPSPGSVGISEGLPDGIENNIIAVIGEGYSAFNTNDGWTGSLSNFEGQRGYWILTDSDISFSYDLETESLSRRSNPYKVAKKPEGFNYIQSTQQAFYFIDEIELEENEIEVGDWLISYCGNTVTGSRQWLGESVDIPVMGSESTPLTAGYCEVDEAPHFKLFKADSQELITLYGDINPFESNGISFIGTLKESLPLPNDFNMDAAYPNPFNPTTAIDFALSLDSYVEISIFDLRGQKIETLINEYSAAGNYSVQWNASQVASGVYFVQFTASGENVLHASQIQKLMLIK